MNKFLLYTLFLLAIAIAAAIVFWPQDEMTAPVAPEGISVSESNDEIMIATSFYPLEEFAQRIAGTDAELIERNVFGSEHNVEPSAELLAELEEADIFFIHGAGLDTWAEDAQAQLEDAGVEVVAVADGIELLSAKGDAYHGDSDPHLWNDPIYAIQMIETMRDEIIQIDPERALSYQERTQALVQELQALDASINQELTECERRNISTANDHHAFQYFEKRYDVEINATTEEQAEEESEEGTEEESEEESKEAITLHTLEGITEEESSRGENYISLMEQNLEILANALGCGERTEEDDRAEEINTEDTTE